MESARRPRLTPPIADVRRAVRGVLEKLTEAGGSDARGAGNSEVQDAAALLLVGLSGGADSLNEYRQYIEKDAALERRFQKVLVESRAKKTPSRFCGV